MYFSNGCLFETLSSESYLGFTLPEPTVLAHYTSLVTNKMSLDFLDAEALEKKYALLQENQTSHQTIASPMFAHAKHPEIKKMKKPAAAVCGNYGKGKVLCFGPHPEGSGDTEKVMKNCFYWLSNLPTKTL